MPYQASHDPETLTLVISATDLDLTTVTSFLIHTKEPNGTVADWSWAVDGVTTASIMRLIHTYDAAGVETAQAGQYTFYGELTTPSTVRRISPAIVNFRRYP